MNQIFLGNRAYGFAAAAERYFGKDIQALNTAEIAMLAGLPQNPVRVNPATNMARAKARQAHVLRRMVAKGVITEAEAVEAEATPLRIVRPKRFSSIADHAAEMVRAEVVARFGEDAYARGLQVSTTLLAAEQAAAQTALRRALFDLERRQTYRGAEGQTKLPSDNSGEAFDDAIDASRLLGLTLTKRGLRQAPRPG